MKTLRLAVSMRITQISYPSGSVELRDSIAHDWHAFLRTALPSAEIFLMPNIGNDILESVKKHRIAALLLTGGDDWGTFPVRDETEMALLTYAHEQALPVIGVCRGMQLMNTFHGGSDKAQAGHTAQHHALTSIESIYGKTPEAVNSFHNNVITTETLGTDLYAYALSHDATVEACASRHKPWLGMMWHPEREPTLTAEDMQLFQNIFLA